MSTKLDTMLGLNYKVHAVNPAILGVINSINQNQAAMAMINSSWVQQIANIQGAFAPIHEYYNKRLDLFSGIRDIALQKQQELARIAANISLPLSKFELQTKVAHQVNQSAITKLASVIGESKIEWIKASTTYINSMKPLLDAASRWNSQISIALRSMNALNINILSNIDIAALRELSHLTSESDYNTNDVELREDGTLVIGGETINHQELTQTVILDTLNRLNGTISTQNKLFRQQNDKIESQEENINILLKEISNLKNSRLKWFLLNIILPVILSILVNNFASPILQPYTDLPVQMVKKIMKTVTINSSISTVELAAHRYVILDKLKIWNGSKIKSLVVTYLKQGEVVRILNKKRNWTYILYIDCYSGKHILGWTLTRYLKKFN